MSCMPVPFCSGPFWGPFQVPEYQYSEILAGGFHWNGTGIHRNDWNTVAISGVLIRVLHSICWVSKEVKTKKINKIRRVLQDILNGTSY